MNDLLIGSTAQGGIVKTQYQQGIIQFEGRFMPENSKDYFAPIMQWVSNYIANPKEKTELIFRLDYFNTSFSKKLLDLMLEFEELHAKGKKVEVHWYCKDADADLLEAGKGYKELVELEFVFKKY